MNSFFASVEQQANPTLRGRPVGVCASLHETSCIIAASKEAKLLGVKTGTLIYKAKKICPKIVLLQAEPEKYREVNRGIVRIFRDYTDRVEVYSIDEAFLDLGSKLQAKNALLIGSEIKARIRREVGDWLTCSIGIAPNKFMAKLAADLKKPDGLSIVFRENLPEVYKTKNFGDLWGVARGWSKRLYRLGILSPSDMFGYPVANLVATFGKPGFYIWQRIMGLEQDEIVSVEDSPKSFGHSWVLNFRTTDKSRLATVVMRLAEKAARRMRKELFRAYGVYVSIMDTEGERYHVSQKLKRSINTGQELYTEVLRLWRNWQFRKDVMHIAVGFGDLVSESRQLDLFGDSRPELIAALDRINDRYGEFTIRPALLAHTQDFAPDAIAFGK